MADDGMMTRLSSGLATARLSAALVAALCLGCEADMGVPKEPIWGKQPCEECAMLLSEPRHGAQLVTADHERLYFDDLGCMVAWMRANPQPPLQTWVRAADDGQWLTAGKAGYRQGEHTPMGYGFVAVAGHGALEWSEVRRLVHARLEER
jgi:hypothetical protein